MATHHDSLGNQINAHKVQNLERVLTQDGKLTFAQAGVWVIQDGFGRNSILTEEEFIQRYQPVVDRTVEEVVRQSYVDAGLDATAFGYPGGVNGPDLAAAGLKIEATGTEGDWESTHRVVSDTGAEAAAPTTTPIVPPPLGAPNGGPMPNIPKPPVRQPKKKRDDDDD